MTIGRPWGWKYKRAWYMVRGAWDHAPRTTHELGEEALQRSGSRNVSESGQGFLFQLPDPFPCDAQLRADLFERHRLLTFETEIQPENPRFPLLQRREHRLDRFGQRVLEDLDVGTRIRRVGQVVEQFVVFARRERRVEREVRLRDRQRLRDFFLRDVHPLSDLLDRRLAPQLLEQRGRAFADA